MCIQICGHKEAFIDYKDQRDRVKSANGCEMNVYGDVSIEFKMIDRKVITLNKVRHVLQIKNILYMSNN